MAPWQNDALTLQTTKPWRVLPVKDEADQCCEFAHSSASVEVYETAFSPNGSAGGSEEGLLVEGVPIGRADSSVKGVCKIAKASISILPRVRAGYPARLR
jgi:hypothetical protein